MMLEVVMITRRRRRSRRVERGRESDDGDNGGSHASELVLDSTIKVLTAARQCDGDDTSVIEALRPAKVTKGERNWPFASPRGLRPQHCGCCRRAGPARGSVLSSARTDFFSLKSRVLVCKEHFTWICIVKASGMGVTRLCSCMP